MNHNRPVVLVIDDDTAVRQTLGAMVEWNGYATRLAGSGEEGVRVYDRHRDEIAAVVLDVRMPGKDGPETLEELWARAPDLPCVFITGFGGRYASEELTGRGAVVLSKPVGMDELGQAIRTVSTRT
ncbi:MAG TPA: response regulator [Urbifossiella sp.]|nr:response regulator [Urbifossiella sp.]